jgi:hypothetical protein
VSTGVFEQVEIEDSYMQINGEIVEEKTVKLIGYVKLRNVDEIGNSR